MAMITTPSGSVEPAPEHERKVPANNHKVGTGGLASNAAEPTSSLGQTVLSTDRQAGSGAPASNTADTKDEGHRMNKLLFWLPSLAIVSLFAFIGRSVFWVADDFCRGAESRDLGLINMQRAEYQNWSGRYTFNALIAVATRFGINASHLAPPIIAALSLGIFTALARRLSESVMPKRYAPLIGVAGCLSLFGLYENFGQSVLWLTGGLTYIAPLLLIAAALLFAFPKASSPQLAAGSRGFAWVLTFLAVGCNEAIGAAIVGSLIVWVLFGGKLIRRELLPISIVSLVGFGIMAAAPGNNTRRALVRPRKLSELPLDAAADTVRLFGWLLSQRTFLVCGAVGFGLILGRTFGKRAELGVLSVSLLVAVPYGTDLLSFVGTGNRLVQRARISAIVPMILGIVLLSWFARSNWTGQVSNANREKTTRLSGLFAFVIAISAVQSVLPAAAAAHNSSSMAEQTTNRLSEGRGTTVPIAIPGPGTIWGLANFSGDGDWALRCADTYFKVKGTYLELKK